ncbi:hypothetical protein ElyMa_005216100, partial [Elysia marginata]
MVYLDGGALSYFGMNYHVAAVQRFAYSTDPEDDTRQIQSYWDSRWIGVRLGKIQPDVQTRTDFSWTHTFSNHDCNDDG